MICLNVESPVYPMKNAKTLLIAMPNILNKSSFSKINVTPNAIVNNDPAIFFFKNVPQKDYSFYDSF